MITAWASNTLPSCSSIQLAKSDTTRLSRQMLLVPNARLTATPSGKALPPAPAIGAFSELRMMLPPCPALVSCSLNSLFPFHHPFLPPVLLPLPV